MITIILLFFSLNAGDPMDIPFLLFDIEPEISDHLIKELIIENIEYDTMLPDPLDDITGEHYYDECLCGIAIDLYCCDCTELEK
jgi:hypothetical protein